MDGIETARNMRKIIGDKVPVLTSYDFDYIEEKAKAVGINTSLSKPFFVSNFRNAIGSILHKASTNSPEEGETEAIFLEGLKVMAAEGNEINVEILVQLLDIEGVTCDIASNGKEAVEMFEKSAPDRYDMIFMDVQMPFMNGYEATREIRACAHPRAKTVPIIAMTEMRLPTT